MFCSIIREQRRQVIPRLAETLRAKFENPDFLENYFKYFGYAFLNSPEDIVPNVPIAFYSFHVMVILGFSLDAVCADALWLLLLPEDWKSKVVPLDSIALSQYRCHTLPANWAGLLPRWDDNHG
jgi:cytochrome bd-type quinol oxidase subunit 1